MTLHVLSLVIQWSMTQHSRQECHCSFGLEIDETPGGLSEPQAVLAGQQLGCAACKPCHSFGMGLKWFQVGTVLQRQAARAWSSFNTCGIMWNIQQLIQLIHLMAWWHGLETLLFDRGLTLGNYTHNIQQYIAIRPNAWNKLFLLSHSCSGLEAQVQCFLAWAWLYSLKLGNEPPNATADASRYVHQLSMISNFFFNLVKHIY